MGYAYKGGKGIIHVVDTLEQARTEARGGKVVEYPHYHARGYPMFMGRSVIIDTDFEGTGKTRVKHAGRLYGRGAWPAGTGFIRDALKELI